MSAEKVPNHMKGGARSTCELFIAVLVSKNNITHK